MATAQMNAALAKVQTTESKPEAKGIIVVVNDPDFDVSTFIKKMVLQFLDYEHDPGSDPRTILVSMSRDDKLKKLKGFVNNGMQPRGSTILNSGVTARRVTHLTYSTYNMLRRCNLPPNTFDFVVVNALAAGELSEFRRLFAELDDLFRVVILPQAMATAVELRHWGKLEQYTVQPMPAALRQPAQLGA
jgi:hypothetical protein